jgi:hypothetical protein
LVRSYSGDTAENFVENMHQFLESARKMGFDTLIAMTHTPEIVRLLKIAARKLKDPAVKTNFDSARGIFVVTTGQKRD